jgi:hypothetical protein
MAKTGQTTIYYFTGTGNSLAVARAIAAGLGVNPVNPGTQLRLPGRSRGTFRVVAEMSDASPDSAPERSCRDPLCHRPRESLFEADPLRSD